MQFNPFPCQLYGFEQDGYIRVYKTVSGAEVMEKVRLTSCED